MFESGGLYRWGPYVEISRDAPAIRVQFGANGIPLQAGLNRYQETLRTLSIETTTFVGSYSLSAESAAYATTVADAGLTHIGVLVAESATYITTVADVSLVDDLLAEQAVYATTVADARLAFTYPFTADAVTYTTTVADAALNTGNELIAEAAVYTYSGGDLSFKTNSGAGFVLQPGFNIYTRGESATILDTDPLIPPLTLDAEAVAYITTVADAGLVLSFNALNAEAVAYATTVADAAFTPDRVIGAETAAYTLTVNDADFAFGYTLTAEVAAYTLTGGAANFLSGLGFTIDGGTYSTTVADAGLFYNETGKYFILAESVQYDLTGADVTFTGDVILDAATAAYTYTGADAGLRAGPVLQADAANYASAGGDVSYTLLRKVIAQTQQYFYSGGNANLLYSESTDIGREPGIVAGTITRSIVPTGTRSITSTTPKRSVA